MCGRHVGFEILVCIHVVIPVEVDEVDLTSGAISNEVFEVLESSWGSGVCYGGGA